MLDRSHQIHACYAHACVKFKLSCTLHLLPYTVCTSYNLNVTRVAHARVTRHIHAITYDVNYLHASSLLVYTQGSFLHAYACARIDTLETIISTHNKTQRTYSRLYGLLLEYAEA